MRRPGVPKRHEAGLNTSRPQALPTLEPRLQAVFEYIRADSHADIGSDHAHLPLHLMASKRV